MFIEWVSVVIGQAIEYELLELSLGDWCSSRWEEALELALAFPKKMAAGWAGHQIIKVNFSLSAHVLERKPIRQPAQKPAVILNPNKRVKYDLRIRPTLPEPI